MIRISVGRVATAVAVAMVLGCGGSDSLPSVQPVPNAPQGDDGSGKAPAKNAPGTPKPQGDLKPA